MPETWTQKWYSIMLPIFPIMILYGFDVLPFVTFSDYILIFFIIVDIFSHRFKFIFNTAFAPLFLYLCLHPILLLFLGAEDIDWIDATGSAWKLALYILGTSLLAKNLQMKRVIKSFRCVGIASSIYAFLQFFLGTFLHISVTPYLPFFPILREGLLEQQDSWISVGWTVRPRAWFSEPSTFAIFLLLALMIELFLVEKEKRNKKLCGFYVLGIIISHSSTGAVGLIILLISWFAICPSEFLFKIKKSVILGILCLLPIGIILLVQSGYITSFIEHTFASGQGIAAQSHFADVVYIFSGANNLWDILLGHGMQNIEGGYLPGWFRAYYCLGGLGVLLYLLSFYLSAQMIAQKKRIIILTFAMLNVGTEVMLGVFMLLYMSIALMAYKNNERLDK